MSNAMRSGKRVLAGVAAVALSAGVMTFAAVGTAGTAQAAVVTDKLAAQATTAVVRTPLVGSTDSLAINVVGGTTASAQDDTVAIQNVKRNGTLVGTVDTVPAGITVAATAPTTLVGSNVLKAAGALAAGATWGTVTVTGALAPGTWTYEANWTKNGGADTQSVVYTFYVSGAPASASWGATSYTSAASSNVNTLIGVRDANGLPTYLIAGESITVGAGTSVITANPSLYDSATLGRTQVIATTVANAGRVSGNLAAASTASGAYTVNAAAAGGLTSFTTSPVTLNVTQLVDNGTRGIAPNQSINPSNGASNTLYVSTAQPSVTFTASSGANNRTYGFTVAAVSGQPLPSGVTAGFTAVAGSNDTPTAGTSTAAFTVTATNPLPGQQYTLTVTGATAYTVIYQSPVAYDLDAPASIAAATGSTVPVTIDVLDQFGDPFAGGVVTWSASGRNTVAASTAVSNASGEAVASFTDTSTSTTNFTTVVAASLPSLTVTGAATQANTSSTSVLFSASIAVDAIVPVANLSAAGAATGTTYAAGTTTSGAGTVYVETLATTNTTKGQVLINATVRAPGGAVMQGIPVTVTGTEGIYFLNNGSVGTVPVLGQFGARTTVTQYSNAAGIVTVQARMTKTGTATVTFTAGGKTATYAVTVLNAPTDARVLSVTPATKTESASNVPQITAEVKDGFGNPVPGTAVTFAESGPAIFGNGASTLAGNTANDGKLTVAIYNNEGEGKSAVSAQVTTTGTQVLALANVAITGFPAGVGTGGSEITWTPRVPAKSISIVGARTTVSGKPGIVVDGVVTGIENGKTVKPFFRFPGETSFTEGSARPVITDGSFTWQRKTGKKFYAYVTSDDGAVQSNRVIIAAN